MSMNNDFYSLIGLATRARKVVFGDALLKSIRSNKVKCVVIAADASDNTRKKYSDKCSYYHIPCFVYGDRDSLSKAVGKNNRVCIGICDKGFSNKIKSMLGG